eukprot:7077654-Karenia_brevis.AAC.1
MGKSPMPRARKSLKGFKKLAPNMSRFPLPWEWTCGLAMSMLWKKKEESALILLLLFDTYMRPGEALGIKHEDL